MILYIKNMADSLYMLWSCPYKTFQHLAFSPSLAKYQDPQKSRILQHPVWIGSKFRHALQTRVGHEYV